MATCSYCGEVEGTEKIADPNLDMGEIDWQDPKNWWMVCQDCKDTIHWQRMSSMAEFINDEKMAKIAFEELDKIAKRTKKPILNAVIKKNKDGTYSSTSVEFTGKE